MVAPNMNLFATFGEFRPNGPDGFAGELAAASGTSAAIRLSPTVRLGLVEAAGRALSPTADDLVVAASGRVEGNGDRTNTIMEAYRSAGSLGLGKLRGEYAFVLWDGRARQLWAGCDPVGLRAPAYVWDGQNFALCSRAIPLLGFPGGRAAWNEGFVAHLLSGIWAPLATATAFRGVRRMLGGELLCVSADGLHQSAPGGLTFGRSRLDAQRALSDLEERLDCAISSTLEEDRVCVALSGGIDSCVVASTLTRRRSHLDAFSLVAPIGSTGASSTLSDLVAQLGVRSHLIHVGPTSNSLDLSALPDDPICAGPALQAARVDLLRAAKEHGFDRVFDGEGGDEIFDLAWRLGDLLRETAVASIASGVTSIAIARHTARDFALTCPGPVSHLLLARARRRLARRRPWLRASFWASSSFALAWEETCCNTRLRDARLRLPAILATHGRYWRAQELVRRSLGIEGSSPFLHQAVVELVGSLHATVALNPRHAKSFLRRLAEQRVSHSLAWRPKCEPLNAWLVERYVSDDANVARAFRAIRNSRQLHELVDLPVLATTVHAARQQPQRGALASHLVDFFFFVDWLSAVEAKYNVA